MSDELEDLAREACVCFCHKSTRAPVGCDEACARCATILAALKEAQRLERERCIGLLDEDAPRIKEELEALLDNLRNDLVLGSVSLRKP